MLNNTGGNWVTLESAKLQVDAGPSSVRFGSTGTEAAPIDVRQKDLDIDKDRDVILRFQIADTGIKCGDTSRDSYWGNYDW